MADGDKQMSRHNALLVAAAQDAGWLDGAMLSVPELAEQEKTLFLAMLRAVPEYLREAGRLELDSDEIISLFNFVYGKAAEAVSAWYLDQPFSQTVTGMFDGTVPLYADEAMLEHFRELTVAGTLSEVFLAEPVDGDPLLLLFDALKITWRIGCHIGLRYLEGRGLIA